MRGAEQAARDPSLLSIGEVLAQLRTDFPDTTISKLRFLETEGLVQPQRTPSGYRKYSPEDVARLRYVLAAQRDQYLPLRVIRQQLDDGAHVAPPPQLDDGAHGAHGAHGTPPPRPALAAVKDEDSGRVQRDDLLIRAGIDAELLEDLERHGLVTASAGDWFDPDAVAVAEVAGRLSAYGIQPRHLRPYRAAADREAGLFAQIVAPMLRQTSGLRDTGERRDLTSRARADEALRELMLLSQRLHLALLRSRLDETLGH